MDIGSMMTAVHQQAARRVANGLTGSTGNGLSTSATATTGRGRLAASSAGATAAATSGSASTSSTNDITADDFLTLLVTEMQNQDPTQPTDPNQYIQQLVGVNSLQELISINNDLTPQTTSDKKGGAAVGSLEGTGTAAPASGNHGIRASAATGNIAAASQEATGAVPS